MRGKIAIRCFIHHEDSMITSQQMRAARALLGIDQRQLAALANVSLPTIQRMEASDGQVRSVVDTLVKVINALETAGIEIIGRSEEHTSELQSLMRISYAVFCLKKKT